MIIPEIVVTQYGPMNEEDPVGQTFSASTHIAGVFTNYTFALSRIHWDTFKDQEGFVATMKRDTLFSFISALIEEGKV